MHQAGPEAVGDGGRPPGLVPGVEDDTGLVGDIAELGGEQRLHAVGVRAPRRAS